MAASGLLPSGHLVGLPSEAMWEYACRAGTETEYWSGDGEAALAEVGWYGEELVRGGPHPVGGLPANPWGLHEMHGNVWEWCGDVWEWTYFFTCSSYYLRLVDGEVMPWPELGARDRDDDRNRVLRGGSLNNTAWMCRSATRVRGRPTDRDRRIGFRLCVFPGSVKDEAPDVDLRALSF